MCIKKKLLIFIYIIRENTRAFQAVYKLHFYPTPSFFFLFFIVVIEIDPI